MTNLLTSKIKTIRTVRTLKCLYDVRHSVENEKFTPTENMLRQINSLGSLVFIVKLLLSTLSRHFA